MSDVVSRAENLGKQYRLQYQQERQRYVALRDGLAARAKGVFRNPQSAIRAGFLGIQM